MNTDDNIKWMLLDSMKSVAYAVIVYAGLLGAYWLYDWLT
jgi:hypothetical protein